MRSKRQRKTAANQRPALKPQPHGGALLAGGMRGNRGGPGRPAERLRVRSREEYELVLDEVRRRRKSGELRTAPLSDLVSLLNTTGRYGLGTADAMKISGDPDHPCALLVLPPEDGQT